MWVSVEPSENICEVGDEMPGDRDVQVGQNMATWPNGVVLSANPADFGIGQVSIAFSNSEGDAAQAAVLPEGATFDRNEAGQFVAGVGRGRGAACFSLGLLTAEANGDYGFEPIETTLDQISINGMAAENVKRY
jgi:hypothetical protein